MESSLPISLISTPLAPVAFVGLDLQNGSKVTDRHSAIWQAFTSERSPDRVPLKVRSKIMEWVTNSEHYPSGNVSYVGQQSNLLLILF